MGGDGWQRILVRICVAASALFLCSVVVRGQDGRRDAPSGPTPSEATPEIRVLADLIRDLQAQVSALNSQLSELRTAEQRTGEEARDLRRELDFAKARIISPANAAPHSSPAPVSQGYSSLSKPASPAISVSVQDQGVPDRAATSEEDQQLIDGKLGDLYQTKVESGSKYRLRLSGIVLLNMYDNRGTVEYQDIPSVAEPPQTEPLFVSPSSFGGTLRQSQIRLQAFGPDIGGARTSADLHFDFSGGVPHTFYCVAVGLLRLRPGAIRMGLAPTSPCSPAQAIF